MELEALLSGITTLTPTAIGIILTAGLIVGVSPGSFPLLSVATGFIAGQDADVQAGQRLRGLILSLGFVLGIALVDGLIGALFGFAGFLVLRVLAQFMSYAYAFMTAMLVFLGLVLLRVVRVRVPVLRPSQRKTTNFFSALVLGIPFGLSTCPACTPVLLPVLAAAAGTGEAFLGGVLLFCFGLARGVPIIIIGTATGVLKQTQRFAAWIPRIEFAGGILLLLGAPYFAYQGAAYAGWVPPLQGLF